MAVLVMFDARYQPDKVDEAIAILQAALPDTRAFDGCIEVTFQRDLDDPAHLALVERWESRAKYEAYTAWRAGAGSMGDGFGKTMAGRPVVTYFEDTGI